jgi:hypothetical protein
VQALLDAMPRTSVRASTSRDRFFDRVDEPGDGLVRTNLAVLADKMQGPGDPLGLWLAAWLEPCRNCTGGGWLVPLRPEQCRVCHGHGILLGEHEPDLLAALEALTWITGRLPKVGDRITVRHAFGDGDHFTGTVSEIERGQVHVSGWWSSLGDGWRYA